MSETGEKRALWSDRKNFIYATIGAAVGLGNLWRFPFQAYKNGGGAFFLPYLVALLTCAIPLLILEFAYGRKIRGGSTKAFAQLGKKFEIIGWVQVMVPVIVVMFYCTIIAIAIIFMGASLLHGFGIFSWIDNPGIVMDFAVGSAENAFDFRAGASIVLILSVLLVWFVNWFVVRRGISGGIEMACRITTPLLLILMLLFMVNSLRLEGAGGGLNALFQPNFAAIMDPSIWIAAYAQVFFSTTLAVGVMIAYGSYLDEKTDIVNSSFITVLGNASFDIVAGITVFSTLGYLVHTQGLGFDSFGAGAGVAFIAFPIAISTMTSIPLLQGLISFIFFFCLFIAGLTSAMSMIESFQTSALDKFKIDRKKLTTYVSLVGMAGSLIFATYAGFNFVLDIVDTYVSNYVIATLGLVETIAICYIFGSKDLREYANEHSDFKIGVWWDFLLKFVTPVLLGATVVTNLIGAVDHLISTDGLTLASELVFGWSVVMLMVIVSIIFYRQKWQVDTHSKK